MALTTVYPEDTRIESPPTEMKGAPETETDLERQIIHLVLAEKIKYELNSNELREIIRKSYRNFLGIFDNPTTKYTKRTKEFWGLTQYHTLAAASNIYVDPKAIDILPRKEEDIIKAKIWNVLIPFQLKQINFFQAINSFSIDLSLFGTVVSSQEWDFQREDVYEEKNAEKYDAVTEKKTPQEDKLKKTKVKVDRLGYKFIPLLNVFTDATAENLQDAPSVIIASWVEASSLPVLKKKFNWKYSVEGIQGTKIITRLRKDDRYLIELAQAGVSQKMLEVPLVEIVQRWAKVPLYWITKKDEDKNTYVEGRVVLLNENAGVKRADKRQQSKILDISVNPYKHGKRPFEECWYIKLPRRWYGLGNGEMLASPNAYLNRVMNQRVDNNEIIQNKMYKARRGSGLDNKSIASAPGKVVTVQNIDDLQPLEPGDMKASSYTDEEVINTWAEKLTHIKDLNAPRKTATEATIEDNIAGEWFAMVRRNINDYLKRVVEQFIALDQQFIEQDITVRMVGETADFEEIDNNQGVPRELRPQLGNYRFIHIDDVSEIRGEFDIEVDIDNSLPMNKATKLQGLDRLLNRAMQDPASGINRQELYKEEAYLLGFKGSRFFTNTQNQPTVGLPGQQITPGQGGEQAPAPFQGVPTNVQGINQAQQSGFPQNR